MYYPAIHSYICTVNPQPTKDHKLHAVTVIAITDVYNLKIL